ncbi:MAG: Ig domain-containing protein [Clostridia bacterium]|nr:Ig domain-containing protein [Clostridia bacterium]
MKKLVLFICFLLSVSCAFVSCGSHEEQGTLVDFVNFSQSDVTLYEGQRYVVATTVAPLDAIDKDLIWNSTHPEVCSVENGVINAHSKGISIISAKTKNGVSANLRVTVKSIDDLKSITFSEIDISLSYGESQALSIISNPATDSQMYTNVWSSSNPEIATVDENGTVTAVGTGSCLIFADISDVARAVCKVNAHAELDSLVAVDIEGVPGSYDTLDVTGRVVATVEITSYDVIRELTTEGVTVTLKIYGTKTYDRDGESAKSALAVPMSMFMENDQHCIDVDLISRGNVLGDNVEFEYRFNAIVKPSQRQFKVYLGGREYDNQ